MYYFVVIIAVAIIRALVPEPLGFGPGPVGDVHGRGPQHVAGHVADGLCICIYIYIYI